MHRATLIDAAVVVAVISLAAFVLLDEDQGALSIGETTLDDTWPSAILSDDDIDSLPPSFGDAVVNYILVASGDCDGCQAHEQYVMPLDDILVGVERLQNIANAQGVSLGRPFEYHGVRFEIAYVTA